LNKYLNPKNYIEYSIVKLFVLIYPIVKYWENKKIKKYASMPLKYQPIFIIGAPRTGSTILYQTITNQLDVLYVDNLICRCYRNLFFGFYLSDKLFKQKAHNSFNSEYGDTKGFHSPSECGGFWYRWLPTDRHFIDYDDIMDNMISEIKNEITAVINYFNKPLVFNNNNVALRIRLLKQVFPDAKYIVADREPIFVSQSLLKARLKFFGTYDEWFSILPKNYKELQNFEYYKQVVFQHYFINKQMYEDLKSLVNSNNFITIQYKDISKNKDKILSQIKCFLDYKLERENYIDNKIVESRAISVDENLEKLLKKEILKLDWINYSSDLK